MAALDPAHLRPQGLISRKHLLAAAVGVFGEERRYQLATMSSHHLGQRLRCIGGDERSRAVRADWAE